MLFPLLEHFLIFTILIFIVLLLHVYLSLSHLKVQAPKSMQCLSLSSCSGIDYVHYAKINAAFDPPTSALKDSFLSFPFGLSLV